EVWKAYTDVRLAFRRLDVASALVKASESSYEAILRSYRLGLSTLVDLLAARRELSRARFQEVDTKLSLLDASVTLAFSTGDASSSARARGTADKHERGPPSRDSHDCCRALRMPARPRHRPGGVVLPVMDGGARDRGHRHHRVLATLHAYRHRSLSRAATARV